MAIVKPDSRFKRMIPKWKLIDMIESNDILAFANWKLFCYLPDQNIKIEDVDLDPRAELRQKQFVKGAKMLAAVSRTINGSVGSVFRRETEIELEPQLEYLRKNADGAGLGLEQFAQDSTTKNVAHGYGGILTDFAESEKDSVNNTREENENEGRYANLALYAAETIIRVSTKKVGSVVYVSSIVLLEKGVKILNEFESEAVEQLRVLTFDDNGNYIQKFYEDADEDKFKEITPKDAFGQPLKYIPFEFFGSKNNSHSPEAPPIYPLATLNQKHLEYSAMRNESIRQHAPTMFLELQDTVSLEEFNKENPLGITMGSWNCYTGIKTATIIQAQANEASNVEMKDIRQEMVEVGASFVTPSVSNVSAETAEIQKSTDTSVLGGSVRNVESAINRSLQHVARFMIRGDAGENFILINRDFINSFMSPDAIRVWSELVMKDQVSLFEFRTLLAKDGLIKDVDAHESFVDLGNTDKDLEDEITPDDNEADDNEDKGDE